MTQNSEETVTISVKEYKSLLDAKKWRIALENGGVDNWAWYRDALEDGGYFDED